MSVPFRIEYDQEAAKALRKMDRQVARRIVAAVGALAQDPRPLTSKRLVGGAGERRIRVGDYRVIYEVRDDALVVLVVKVGHRSEVYR